VTGAFRALGEREVLRARMATLAVGTFEAPDGSTFEREVVHHPGWVAAVPLLDDGRSVLCVRQYRAPIDALLLEIPAGLRDVDGEPPERTAARELAEEAGRRADHFELLARVHNSAGFCDEAGMVYLATGLSEVDLDLQGVEEANMTIEVVDLADVPSLVADGRLTDAKTIIGLLAARERLGVRG
jgi:ADP-ribose pyrophosphatase